MALLYILWSFWYIWYIFSRFGMLYQEKSGNPGFEIHDGFSKQLQEKFQLI
jgi:hypothetical protein